MTEDGVVLRSGDEIGHGQRETRGSGIIPAETSLPSEITGLRSLGTKLKILREPLEVIDQGRRKSSLPKDFAAEGVDHPDRSGAPNDDLIADYRGTEVGGISEIVHGETRDPVAREIGVVQEVPLEKPHVIPSPADPSARGREFL